jgi:hypothetical protein
MQVSGAGDRHHAGGSGATDEAMGAGRRAAGAAFQRAAQRAVPLTRAADPPPTGGALSSWFRPEWPARAATGPPAATAAPSIERVLVGTGPQGEEARILIGAGPLAGTEIRLLATGGVVEAQLLTRSESSSQTLAVALGEVKVRLRARGLVLRTVPADRGRPGWHRGPPEAAP